MISAGGRSIRGLLRDYNELHPHLSTHAKVHPPGPIVVLWMLSYAVLSRGPLMLSPGHHRRGKPRGHPPCSIGVRDLTSERTAFTCSFLYVLVPTTVLFTATSADILFIPFVTATLFTFWRALDRSAMASLGYAAAAGILYAILSLLSFSLIGLGAFFGLAGLWRLTQRGKRAAVVRTGVVMVAAFLLTHLAVRLWSGFDVVACFHICKAQFDEDQLNLNIFRPRYPSWVYRFLNPACWAFFAGVPVTVLFVWRLFRPEKDTRGLFVVFALTLVALDLLYLARGEGERSAMYILLLPFMAVPAAHLLDQLGRRVRSTTPLTVTLVFLALSMLVDRGLSVHLLVETGKLMWHGKSVSVVFPTYNEKDSIRGAVEDFFGSGYVDEVVVVNNNAAEGTDEEVRPTKARLVHETRQGYGHAIWRGLHEATGDLLIIAEPDGTFSGHDVRKLLAYSDDVPVVFGTRTQREFVWEGANMGIFLKWGNWAVAKMVEFLFNTTLLTDVGCSMRLFKRTAYEQIAPLFSVGGSAFGPQLLLLTILSGIPFIEIPVNYKKRVGESSVTGSKFRAALLGTQMILMILRHRLLSWFGWRPTPGANPYAPGPGSRRGNAGG